MRGGEWGGRLTQKEEGSVEEDDYPLGQWEGREPSPRESDNPDGRWVESDSREGQGVRRVTTVNGGR